LLAVDVASLSFMEVQNAIVARLLGSFDFEFVTQERERTFQAGRTLAGYESFPSYFLTTLEIRDNG